MVHAFVMLESEAASSESLSEQLLGIPGVGETHVVAGEFDIITEVDGDEIYDVLHSVVTEIQELEGVAETKTYVSLS